MTVYLKEMVPAGKGRKEVLFDGAASLILYHGEIKKYDLRPDMELSLETYENIRDTAVLVRAKKRAMHLLEQYDRTEYQIRQKLTAGKYPKCVIDETIAYLYSYHYLDDARYADNYLAFSSEKKSRGQLTAELMRRGIDREVVLSAIERCEPADEAGQIRAWLEKKNVPSRRLEEKEYRKIYGFLARKGFQSGDIISELRHWSETE
jgi:regulatory protein